jgi:hypothetical protein
MRLGEPRAWADQRELNWDGSTPLLFDPGERYFVIVHGVLYGWCAVLDTDARELTPCFIGTRTNRKDRKTK